MPRPSRHHQLETRSRIAFESALPRTWIYRPSEPDHGVDGAVEIFDEDGRATGMQFYVQLKATNHEDPARTFHVRLHKSEIAYFTALMLPVLMVRYSAATEALFARWFHECSGSSVFRWRREDVWSQGRAATLPAAIREYATHPAWLTAPVVREPEALKELETLLAAPGSNEASVEQVVMSTPLFMRALNYHAVHRQVVLARPGQPDLIPDIIGERADDGWAEIVEFKRPHVRVLVGRRDRARPSMALVEAVAQLREYAAYFEDPTASAAIRERYGFRCYRPGGLIVVGRDPTGFSESEVRRALTSFPDVRIITFDDLLRAARRLA